MFRSTSIKKIISGYLKSFEIMMRFKKFNMYFVKRKYKVVL